MQVLDGDVWSVGLGRSVRRRVDENDEVVLLCALLPFPLSFLRVIYFGEPG